MLFGRYLAATLRAGRRTSPARLAALGLAGSQVLALLLVKRRIDQLMRLPLGWTFAYPLGMLLFLLILLDSLRRLLSGQGVTWEGAGVYGLAGWAGVCYNNKDEHDQPESTNPYTIGLAQINPRSGRCGAQPGQAPRLLASSAAAEGVDLLVFPEASLTGYYLQDLTDDVAMPGRAAACATWRRPRRHSIDLCVGFIEEDTRYVHYISQAYFSGGALVHLHRKVYLPTYGMFDDMRYVGVGRSIRAFDTRFGRLGMLICEDFWHISSPYLLWQDGADTLLLVSAGPGAA